MLRRDWADFSSSKSHEMMDCRHAHAHAAIRIIIHFDQCGIWHPLCVCDGGRLAWVWVPQILQVCKRTQSQLTNRLPSSMGPISGRWDWPKWRAAWVMQGQRESTTLRISVGAPILLCFGVMKVCDERRKSNEGYSLPFTHFLFLLSFRQFSIDEYVCVCQCDVRASLFAQSPPYRKNSVPRAQALLNECGTNEIGCTTSHHIQQKLPTKNHLQKIDEASTRYEYLRVYDGLTNQKPMYAIRISKHEMWCDVCRMICPDPRTVQNSILWFCVCFTHFISLSLSLSSFSRFPPYPSCCELRFEQRILRRVGSGCRMSGIFASKYFTRFFGAWNEATATFRFAEKIRWITEPKQTN